MRHAIVAARAVAKALALADEPVLRGKPERVHEAMRTVVEVKARASRAPEVAPKRRRRTPKAVHPV